MTKNELRIKYKKLRSEISPSDADHWSLLIANNILKMDIWNHQYFHIFLSMANQIEVNTEFILHLLSGKDKEIVLSKSDFSTTRMTHFLLTDNTKIVLNRFGIPEPADGLEVPAAKLHVVFVPLLAYDKRGHRVGYGKGFYDLFLSECPQAIKIGLSFFEPEDKIEGVFDSDMQLDFCVTPEKVWRF